MKPNKIGTALLFSAVLRSVTLADSVSLAPSKDNSIFQESGTLSNGKGIYVFTGLINNNFLRRGLMAFNVSSIPSNATITSASLSLFLTKMGPIAPGNISLKRVSRDWGEGNSNSGSPGAA